MSRTVVQEFDETVDVRPPAKAGREAFWARLQAHAVDGDGEWWARVCHGVGPTVEWVPVWWVYRAELTPDDDVL